MTKPSYSRGRLSALLGGALVCAGALTFGCLERPVVPQKPVTSNVFVSQISNTAIDKIDLLFVIDNSTSMADKQSILENAVPQMVTRLVTPDCVTRDADGVVDSRVDSTPGGAPGDNPNCPAGTTLEFKPINDIHIGVITSSLGGHGSEQCKREGNNDNDKSYLLPNAPKTNDDGVPLTGNGIRPALPTPGNTGFLVWYPVAKPDQDPARPIVSDLDALTEDFKAQVVAVAEYGCGFEASLEAWYRFLVDPSPPAGMALANNQAASTGVDQVILDQRAAFLRTDSLVAIVLLTDENDCSAMEGGPYYPLAQYGWLVSHTNNNSVSQNVFLPVATAACEDPAKGPNDPCCFSCLLTKAPAACTDTSAISVCQPAPSPKLAPELDRANARCFENKRRFGIDLLYPTERYISGLSSTSITDTQTGDDVSNPLLLGTDGATPRPPGLVFFAGIVGVPWQDIATPDSLSTQTKLKYLTAKQLLEDNVTAGTTTVNRWAVILGDPKLAPSSKQCLDDPKNAACGAQPLPPLDPFMVESIEPRTLGALNPIDGTIAITAAPGWNAINGHEYNNAAQRSTSDASPANDDLQYSCIFPLSAYPGKGGVGSAVKEDCEPADAACDCGIETGVTAKGSPLCKLNPADTAGTTQYWGKAYPATRVLEVLKGFGDNSIVASICPKISDDTSADYGYNPAVGAIVDRLAEKLAGTCLPRGLTISPDKTVPCTIVEALDPTVGLPPLDCTAPGRTALKEEIAPAVIKVLKEAKLCTTDAECKAFSMCGVLQLTADLPGGADCLNNTAEASSLPNAGYCYIDPSQGVGNEELVKSCPATGKRILRFVGQDTPKPKTITFVACTADAAAVISTPVPGAAGAGN